MILMRSEVKSIIVLTSNVTFLDHFHYEKKNQFEKLNFRHFLCVTKPL